MKFSISICLKKIATRIIALLAAWLSGRVCASGLNIPVDLISGIIYVILEVVRNFLKVKYPDKFKFL